MSGERSPSGGARSDSVRLPPDTRSENTHAHKHACSERELMNTAHICFDTYTFIRSLR